MMRIKPAPAVLEAAERAIATLHELARHGHIDLALDPRMVLDRSDSLPLDRPTHISPNGSCRLLPTLDGWIAVNLPRTDDRDLVPAWTHTDWGLDPWETVTAAARREATASFAARGAGLGLPVAILGESCERLPGDRLHPSASTGPGGRLRVLDLSSLWAGPLCGSILALFGHAVLKVESATRPDPIRIATPLLDMRLNSLKERRATLFDRATVASLIGAADVVITSSRPRAFHDLGVSPARLCEQRPDLLWIAVTAHGWSGPENLRVGFGDDCAVAGGLVQHNQGKPVFAGDAVADPLTGLSAAIRAIRAIQSGHGGLIDAALSQVAAAATKGTSFASHGD